jgi:biotin carboxylase
MNRETLLVLAASKYQIPTIQTAKELGYRVITADNLSQNPGHKLADSSYYADTTSLENILEIASQENITGIIAPCTDVAVPTAAFVAEKLNLQNIPFFAAKVVCSKINFRHFLSCHKFPTPHFYPINSDFEPNSEIFQNSHWILKPDTSSGSKGIFVVDSLESFHNFFSKTLQFSPNKKVILEEYIQGFQGTCEGVLVNGELAVAIILDRQTVGFPYTTTCGHHLPTYLPNHLNEKLLRQIKLIWKLLGITDGLFDCDFVATSDEVYILELSPRLGGNSISTLIETSTGLNLVKYAVEQACGKVVGLPESLTIYPSAVILLGVMQPGCLYYDRQEINRLKKEPWVKSLDMDVDCGTIVSPFVNSRHRVGEALIVANTRELLDARTDELKQRLNLNIS